MTLLVAAVSRETPCGSCDLINLDSWGIARTSPRAVPIAPRTAVGCTRPTYSRFQVRREDWSATDRPTLELHERQPVRPQDPSLRGRSTQGFPRYRKRRSEAPRRGNDHRLGLGQLSVLVWVLGCLDDAIAGRVDVRRAYPRPATSDQR